MPPIYINGQQVTKRYVGITEVIKAYVGAQQVFSSSTPSDGVFYDSSVSGFLSGLSVPADATLTATAGSIAFSSATAKSLNVSILDDSAAVFEHCLDDITIDATYTLTSFPAVDVVGVLTGLFDYNNFPFSGEINAHPGSATTAHARTRLNNSPLVSDASGYSIGAGISIQVRVSRIGDLLNHRITYAATAPRDLNATMVLTVTSYELPRLFCKTGNRFVQGVLTLNSLKVTGGYPNAKYAFCGDSITQGRFASAYADAFPQLMRADYPGNVIVAGAPSATVDDWLSRTWQIRKMKPKYVFIMLGTNDIGLGTPLATIQANYTTLVNTYITAGIIPIVLAVTPRNSIQAETFNTWLAAQGWRFVDTYTPLLGSGYALAAPYNSGDNVHLTSAGNLVIKNTIAAAIAANGWT